MSTSFRGTMPTRVALLLPVVLVVGLLGVGVVRHVGAPGPRLTDRPPAAAGYFSTLPPGSWRGLPDDRTCAGLVHRSMWEPRPDNSRPNHRMPDARRVHAALALRPRAVHGAYPKRWDRWLLHRVTGHFTGTTDEVFQWAACKWGLSDNLLRAIAARESGWYQYEVYPDGTCVSRSGCGDVFDEGHDGQPRLLHHGEPLHALSPGLRSRSLSQDVLDRRGDVVAGPFVGADEGQPERHLPVQPRLARRSPSTTSGRFLRGCYEGWVTWLHHSGHYGPGNMRGCVGTWYDGAWFAPDARTYINRVWRSQRETALARARDGPDAELPCSPDARAARRRRPEAEPARPARPT